MKFIESLGYLVRELDLTPQQSSKLRTTLQDISIGFWVSPANLVNMPALLTQHLVDEMRALRGRDIPETVYCRIILSAQPDFPLSPPADSDAE